MPGGAAAGGEGAQTPHAADEVYHVLAGKARLRVAGEIRDVGPGSIVLVRANAEHRFVDVEQELVALLFFTAFRETSGGIVVPLTPTECKPPAERLRFELTVERSRRDRGELRIRFGPHMLSAGLVMHPAR